MKIIAYSILNCGDAVIIVEENGVRSKHIEKNDKFPNLFISALMKSDAISVSKMDDLDKYL